MVKEISVVLQGLKVLKDHKGQLQVPQVLKVMLVLQDLQVILGQQVLKVLHHKVLKVLKERQELKVPLVLMGLKELQGLKEVRELKVFLDLQVQMVLLVHQVQFLVRQVLKVP